MSESLVNYRLSCPYCGEDIMILLDSSVTTQSYYEDCSICCRPIMVEVGFEGGNCLVRAFRDDD